MTTEPDEPDEALVGGNMNEVVRIGETVHRSSGAWTPTVHALLDHLADVGFTAAPRALGRDTRGREILTYLPGTVPVYPLPKWVFAEDTLVAVAQLLSSFHNASSSFVVARDAVWQLPAHPPFEVICHNDFAPYNLVWNNARELVGVIDFDTASPGSRVWDLAYVAYRFVPLVHPDNADRAGGRDFGLGEKRRRVSRLCAAYGDERTTPGDVVSVAISRLDELADFIVTRADAGDPAQRAVRARGDHDLYRRDAAWLKANRLALAAPD